MHILYSRRWYEQKAGAGKQTEELEWVQQYNGKGKTGESEPDA